MSQASFESKSDLSTDILILGAGPVGMTLALALAGSPQRITLVDAKPRNLSANDPRALALSHGTRQLLESLSAWNAKAATPIDHIHVSQRGGFGRTCIQAEDYRLPSLGYVMRYGDLAAALDTQVTANPGLTLLTDTQIVASRNDGDGLRVQLEQHGETRHIHTRLLVHAEGTPYDDPQVSVQDYRQHAVLAEVQTATPHQRRAWERFTPDGPLALLPLDSGYAIVFTVPPAKADWLMGLDDQAFLAALQEQFGPRLTFTATGPRARFPLALRLREQLAKGREIWVGNAAQTLHPVSGQGFNLGLRDAWELAQQLLPATDPGAPEGLAAYVRGRRGDRRGSVAFTDGIVRLFSNDIAPLRLARGLGLTVLDLFPPARHFVAKRMIWGARAWP